MHIVPSFTDGLLRMPAKIKAFPKLDYFQDKPQANRANYFLCFHREARELRAVSPAHLPKTQAPAGARLRHLCPRSSQRVEGPRGPAGGRATSFISQEVFESVLIKGTMNAFLISPNFNFKYVARAGVEVSA